MKYDPYTPINFNKVEQNAELLASAIENDKEKLIDILLEYESYEVATDEIARTLDHLTSLRENKNYFKLRVGAVATFLPRNQPLYSFTCFVVIPSLMASEVHFRIPHSMRGFLPKVFKHIDIFRLFPNIIVSHKERMEFLKDRSALRINPKTGESRPVTDVVIFTGTPIHADQLRLVFDQRTLFISNGAGHNPVVVSKSANIPKAVEAVLTLSLYNQGQDCAAPNAILVHQNVYKEFMGNLQSELYKIKIGPYHDRSCRVGPISDPKDLKRIESIIIDNREWLDKKTSGVIRNAEAIVEPTIICKPLKEGGNYEESFAPILFIQKYVKDKDLALYFENRLYFDNAMYVTLYGKSDYTSSLIGRIIGGKILHHKNTFLHNTHLHAPGIERGTQPYGGYGLGASSISIHQKKTAMPTLPQRNIFEWVAKPLVNKKINNLAEFTQVKFKNIEKILRLRSTISEEVKMSENIYLDLNSIKVDESRFIKLDLSNTYRLLNQQNAEYIITMNKDDLHLIQTIKKLLKQRPKITFKKFSAMLFDIPKKRGAAKKDNSKRQLKFFQNVYQLLFKKDHGPRLDAFLWELKEDTVYNLLDV